MESIPSPYTTEWSNESHVPEILSFLRENFDKEENILRCMKKHDVTGEDEELMWKDHEQIINVLIAETPCLIVLDVSTKKIIGAGVMIVDRNPKIDETANEGSVFDKNPPKTKLMKTYFSYMSQIIDKACLFDRFSEAKVGVELYAVAVHKNFRRKGLGTTIIAEAISFVKDIVEDVGFIFGLCTSMYSRKAFEKLGFECALEEDMLEYKDELGRFILRDTSPHNIASVLTLKV
nr:uncharacterized protein LOC116426033 [Nomia melanderi]